MEITWLGHACFLIRGREVAVLTDPFNPSSGYPPIKIPTDIDVVTISVDDPLHNFLDAVKGYKRVIRGPGEYQLGNIFITGVRIPKSSKQPETYNRNTIYRIELEDLSLCHLGQIQSVPSNEQLADLSAKVDILFVPVGSEKSLNPKEATEVINLVKPRMVIPMLYKTEGTSIPLNPITDFAKVAGLNAQEKMPKLIINRSGVPSERKTVLLGYSS